MGAFEIVAALLTLAAAFSYLNHKFLRWPAAIALMVMSLTVSLGLIALGPAVPSVVRAAEELLRQRIDFSELLLKWMLGFLLFAGALHVDLNDLSEHKWSIGTFATVGVVGSTALVGGAVFVVSGWLGLGLPLVHCLLFGALISPTDPIAVLAILRKAKAPKGLSVRLAGESLFNDGVGVVVFLTLLGIAAGGVSARGVAVTFAAEVAGGVAFGLAIGYAGYCAIKSIDNYQVEVLVTLALVTGGYAAAGHMHISAPIAIVVAGLLIGNHGRRLAMSEKTRQHLDDFWELLDEILNAVLFVLIGLEALVLTLSGKALLAGALAVPVVLLSRLICVGGPVLVLSRRRPFIRGATVALTWGGLRGGISVALALSLPKALVPGREAILTMTYVVVAFSVLAQGLTIAPLVRSMVNRRRGGSAGETESA